MYDKILIPTDGSPTSELAITHGLELARAMSSNVTFLHVLENPLTTGYATPATLPYSAQFYQDLKASAAAVLEQAENKARSLGVSASSTLIENRDPAQAIADASEDHDLVVMGTHGRSGFNRWMFGSVAEGALRRANKPFLLIRDEGEEG
ncbi:MAG TPA: universal stress protein [Trueperaceae bacterium]|nr:universal stress protein [Trueperaceae bacterium]